MEEKVHDRACRRTCRNSLTEFANRISVEYCDVSLSDDTVEAVSVELNIEPNASLELTLDYNTEVAYPAIETDNLK